MNVKHLRQLRVTEQAGPQRCNPKCAPLFTTVYNQGGLFPAGLLNCGGVRGDLETYLIGLRTS